MKAKTISRVLILALLFSLSMVVYAETPESTGDPGEISGEELDGEDGIEPDEETQPEENPEPPASVAPAAFTEIMLSAEPLYTVRIPGKLNLNFGENYLPIEVSEAQYLDGKEIAITFEGSQCSIYSGTPGLYYYKLELWRDGEVPYFFLDGEWLEYNFFNTTNGRYIYEDSTRVYAGGTLLQFAGNETQNLGIDVEDWSGITTPDVPYTGHIIFGIKLV